MTIKKSIYIFPALLACLLASVGIGHGQTAIVGATLMDGNGGPPVEDAVIVIEGRTITALGRSGQLQVPAEANRIDARGKYIIPGLMDANVHLFRDVSVEFIARYEGRFDDLIEEAAQIALKQGLTTVFDTWGPLQSLMDVRDRIKRGETVGSRMFVAGNIVGFSGPFGREFNAAATWTAASDFVKRINWMFAENTGPELLYMTPEQVGIEIRKYIARGIDFLKYGVGGHDCTGCSGLTKPLGMNGMLLFSLEAQRQIVRECRRAGITVQTHTTSVESLRQAAHLGVNLLQHSTETGPTPIPDSTIKMILEKNIYAAELPHTEKRLEFAMANPDLLYRPRAHTRTQNENIIRFIRSGVAFALATDAGVSNPTKTEAESGQGDFGEEHPEELGEAHFLWFKAMAQKGMSPMDALVSATRNVAAGYGMLDQIGTLEVGKLADLVILDADPLQDVNNFRRIDMIFKDGKVVDRNQLPIKKVLTAN